MSAAAEAAWVVGLQRANGPTKELPCWPELLVLLARIELAVAVMKLSYCVVFVAVAKARR
jgi:hypothetical protein